MTSRNVCLTINNWTQEEFDKVRNYAMVTYGIIGKEKGENGTPHLQCYLELKNSVKFTTMKRLWPRAHIENRKGSGEQASNYCKKEEDFVEWGELKNQGKRTDLEDLASLVKEGMSAEEICMAEPMSYHVYGRTLNKIEEIVNRKKFRTWQTKGLWLYGPTGVGKTRYWSENWNPEEDYKLNFNDNGFWDGYVGQKRVIIDEFRGQIPYSELLSLMDRCPHTVKRKGLPPFPFLAEEVIITSSLCPEEVYKNLSQNDSMEQLKRRCEVKYLGVSENSSSSRSGGGVILEPPTTSDTDEIMGNIKNIILI